MIQSIWQIDFTTATGTTRLLDYGDVIAEEIRPSVTQRVSEYSGLGAEWGSTLAQGGAITELDWVRRQNHASHAALRAAVMRAAATFRPGQTGTLCLTIQGSESWNISDCTLLSTQPQAAPGGEFATLTAWSARGGKMLPASPIPLYAGIPWQFILQNWNTITTTWTTY